MTHFIGRHRRSWLGATVVAGSLVAGLVAMLPVDSAAGRPSTAPAAAASTEHWTVTLVTGERVMVTRDPHGGFAASVLGPATADVMTATTDDHLYVVPLAVQSLVGPVLDPALFDVRELIAQGLDDAQSGQLPVIVSQVGAEDAARLEASTGGALDARRVLPKLGMVTGAVIKGKAGRLGDQFAVRAGGRAGAGGSGMSGVARMWLSRRYQVTWDRNLEQVGAPAAWSAGADGAGVKVAVLDTGIDATHPDLAGKVVASQDFSGKGNVVDGHGHGTHVAALAAGSGAGNAGARKGVAPGASLLVGKVLADSGFGGADQVLAGMEWAVAQGADVVNLSLGSGATDGTDPLSLAVNRLTEEGTLFVIAAGNSGPRPETVGAPGAADAALTVAAADPNDAIARFSSRGPRKGDKALKPDVSSPGVGIVAARAAGTSMGTPVDERYTAASGTSMAAPQVAGAAAVLLHRHPDWTPARVKAALAGTADPVAGDGPFAQGAGRIDVAEALAATVLPEDEDADLGVLRWPQPAMSTQAVAWRNEGSAAVTLRLTLDVRDATGATPPADTVWLSAPEVTVPAGGTARVNINVDGRRTVPGAAYAGYLTAVGGTEQLQIPVGFYDEPESYDLIVRGIDRTGAPAAGQSFFARNVDDFDATPFQILQFGADGVGRVRVPPGNYYLTSVMSRERNVDPGDSVPNSEVDSVSRVTIPEVAVAANTSVTLDARTSLPVRFGVEGVDVVASGTSVTERRVDAGGSTMAIGLSTFGEAAVHLPATLSPVRVGTLSTMTARRMVPRQAELRTTGPHSYPVRAALAQALYMPEWTDRRLEPVDVGTGSTAEFAAARLAGRMAVVRRGTALPELADRAKAAGAAVLAVTNDQPGVFRGPYAAPLAVPAIIVDGADAGALRTAAVRRQALSLTTRPYADMTYDLAETGIGRYVPTRTYSRQDVRRFAGVEAHYPLDGRITRPLMSRTLRDRSTGLSLSLDSWDVAGRVRRIEYVKVGYETETLTYGLLAGRPLYLCLLWGRPSTPAAGERTFEEWFGAPLHTSIGTQSRYPIHRYGSTDTLFVSMSGLADGDLHAGLTLNLDGGEDVAGSLELYRNGVLTAQVPGLSGELPLSADPARYRLVSTFTNVSPLTPLRTRSVNTWEFDSGRAADRKARSLPLPEIDYDLALDSAGRVTSRMVGVKVRPQVWPGPSGSLPPVSAVDVREVEVWYSSDDGSTWRPARQLGYVRGNSLSGLLPELPKQGKLSLRAEVVTSDGVRHSQILIGAGLVALNR